MAPAGWGVLGEELDADVRRVADRLRSLSQARLAAPVNVQALNDTMKAEPPAIHHSTWPPLRK